MNDRAKESEEPDYGEEEELEEEQEKDTGELEEEKTADEDIDIDRHIMIYFDVLYNKPTIRVPTFKNAYRT